MPRQNRRVRVEKGLYREGPVYWACATAPGSRSVRWRKIGKVGIQEARRARDKFAYKLKGGLIASTSKTIRLDDLASKWFQQLDELEQAGELGARTVASYKAGVRLHLLPQWASRDADSLTPDDLARWGQQQRASGAAAWSIRARWMSVRGLLGYAVREGHLGNNPCDALTRREVPKPGRARTRYLSHTEIEALLGGATREAQLIIALMIFTGTRAAEVLGLTWANVDFEAHQVHIHRQMSRKGNKRVKLKTEEARRDVIMMDELGSLLRAAKIASRFSRDGDLVIGNGVGKTLGYTRLLKAFTETAAASSIQDASPHTCRHTFASILIDNGRSVEFVSQQLGHSSVKTTWDIYVHLFRAREQADAARAELDAGYGHMLRKAGDRPEP